jgi:ubiquinone/menaquinone biosynthesis C-methylase UbiE
VGLFRKSAPAEPLGVTMAGVKLGQRVIAVGGHDPKLIAQLAIKTGLTGRACLVDDDEARLASAAAEVEKEGALVEPAHAPYAVLPFEAGSFDVAVVSPILASLGSQASVCAAEVFRVLRPGGRAIVIEPAKRGGLHALVSRQPAHPAYTGALATLQAAGFRAVRELASAGGVSYVEGIKKA